jgi:hypothetical protein
MLMIPESSFVFGSEGAGRLRPARYSAHVFAPKALYSECSFFTGSLNHLRPARSEQSWVSNSLAGTYSFLVETVDVTLKSKVCTPSFYLKKIIQSLYFVCYANSLQPSDKKLKRLTFRALTSPSDSSPSLQFFSFNFNTGSRKTDSSIRLRHCNRLEEVSSPSYQSASRTSYSARYWPAKNFSLESFMSFGHSASAFKFFLAKRLRERLLNCFPGNCFHGIRLENSI